MEIETEIYDLATTRNLVLKTSIRVMALNHLECSNLPKLREKEENLHQQYTKCGSGSCLKVCGYRFILTKNDFVAHTNWCEVDSPSHERAFDAYVHERNTISDLALLRVVEREGDKDPKDCRDDPEFWWPNGEDEEEMEYITLKEGLPFLGEVSYACGFPRDSDSKDKNEICVTRGVVSRISRSKFPFIERQFENTTIQIDAATNQGVLGGMALNEFGEMIGMPVHYTAPDQAQLQSYLIPSDTILNFINATILNRYNEFKGYYGLDPKLLSYPQGSLQPIGYSPSALEFYGLDPNGDDTGMMVMNDDVEVYEGAELSKLAKRELVTHMEIPAPNRPPRVHKISNDGFTKIYENVENYADPGIEIGHFVSTHVDPKIVTLTIHKNLNQPRRVQCQMVLYKNVPVSQSPEYFVEVHYMVLGGYVLFEKSSASLRELFRTYQNSSTPQGKVVDAETELVQCLEDGDIFVYRTVPTQTTRGNAVHECHRVTSIRGMTAKYVQNLEYQGYDIEKPGMQTFVNNVEKIKRDAKTPFLILELDNPLMDNYKGRRQLLMITADIKKDSREAADLLNIRETSVPKLSN